MRILKSIITFILLLGGINIIQAQEVIRKQNNGPFVWLYENLVLILGIAIILWVLFSLISLSASLLSLQKARLMKELGMGQEEIMEALNVSTWKRLNEWAWNIVPVSNEADIDLGHDYDGIRELDNRLPPWWLILFYGGIIFGIVYMFVYHRPGGDWSSEQEYQYAIEDAAEMKKTFLAQAADAIDETTVTLLSDSESLAKGLEIYLEKCAVCHGQQGEGLVGPNFTDQYWIHGGSIQDLFSTVKYGVPQKGMISWSSQLRPSEMQLVSSYILTLQGTNPPNQKDKEGELYSSGEAESGNQIEEEESVTEI